MPLSAEAGDFRRLSPRLAVLILVLTGVVALPVPSSAAESNLALGAYISGAPWEAGKLDEFADLVGRRPAVVMWYQDWVHAGVRDFDPVKMNAVAARGARPMISWEPWDYTGGVDQKLYSLKHISAGKFDPFIRRWATDARAWGGTFYLRFAAEMNGSWFPWAVGVNGNTAADYVRAWRHVVGIFRRVGVDGVRWIWSPNIDYPGATASFASIYPGKAYVDWLALDGYNWGTSAPGHSWQSLTTVFGASYDSLAALDAAKPMMIAETASSEEGGDKASWITSAMLTEMAARFPRFRALVWFDEQKETSWLVDSSSGALDALRAAAAYPVWSGKLP